VGLFILSTLATVDSSIQRGWTPLEIASRLPLDNWNSYSAVLESSPLRTKAITSATVYAIGDCISQVSTGKDVSTLDRGRVLRSTLAGLLGHGPLSHLWYNLSEGAFQAWGWEGWLYKGIDWSFIPKVAVDQTTWGPFWNNMYILLLGGMQLRKPNEIFAEMKETTVPLIVSGLKLWPLAHCVTYGLVPVQNRLLWVDLVEIIWVTILSTKAAEMGRERGATQQNE
jgi:protein Mpv17